MEGKIDKNGKLKIKRGKEYKDQKCPYDIRSEQVYICGDHCPQFGEPKNMIGSMGKFTALSICQNRILEFEQFEDERGENG